MTLEQDYTLAEVAEALQMSPRWVRAQVAAGAAHQRYGNRLRFTVGQVDALRARFTQQPAGPAPGITTRRRSAKTARGRR